ncbi:MAG: bifunctional oligoribonuclease/PAP phosphatase NrnA [Anaerolineaceae bacterium]|jgi:phosphoesterase RecJ-like protein
MAESLDEKIRLELGDAHSIAIVSHIRPDGDAVGSLLGLGQALITAGKQVQMVLQDGVAEKYRYLKGSELVKRALTDAYDYLIVVDCSDIQRTGTVLSEHHQPDLVVDHHKTNLYFGRLNLVVEEAVATSSILAEHLPKWGLVVGKDVASSLITGIIADTIGFRTSNMSSQALRVTADLMDKGVDLPSIYHQTLLSHSMAEMRYWGQGLRGLSLEQGILWTSLTLDDRIKAGYPENDDADLVNLLSSISQILVAVLFVEQEDNRVKVSWRSVEGIDVSGIAFEFGGGGHAAAAGADIPGSLKEVQDRVLQRTRELINQIVLH